MSENSWKNYEEVARDLIYKFKTHFGLMGVERKQKIEGKITGTKWEIDCKGIKENEDGIIIIECKRYTKSKLDQETLSGLAYRIKDTGSRGGIMVSPLGHQIGAKKVADANNIVEVKLSSDSSIHEYFMQFLNKVMIGVKENVAIKDSIVVVKKDVDGNIIE